MFLHIFRLIRQLFYDFYPVNILEIYMLYIGLMLQIIIITDHPIALEHYTETRP